MSLFFTQLWLEIVWDGSSCYTSTMSQTTTPPLLTPLRQRLHDWIDSLPEAVLAQLVERYDVPALAEATTEPRPFVKPPPLDFPMPKPLNLEEIAQFRESLGITLPEGYNAVVELREESRY